MSTLQAEIALSLAVKQAGANAFSSGPFWDGTMTLAQAITNGTTAGKADLAYLGERTVASGANDDLDLAGVLTDALGATVTVAELVALLIINKPKAGAANTTSLTVGGGTNPVVGFLGGTTPTVKSIGPGGVLFLMSPDAAGLGAVAAGTADILRITNASGAAATYQIALLARTA